MCSIVGRTRRIKVQVSLKPSPSIKPLWQAGLSLPAFRTVPVLVSEMRCDAPQNYFSGICMTLRESFGESPLISVSIFVHYYLDWTRILSYSRAVIRLVLSPSKTHLSLDYTHVSSAAVISSSVRLFTSGWPINSSPKLRKAMSKSPQSNNITCDQSRGQQCANTWHHLALGNQARKQCNNNERRNSHQVHNNSWGEDLFDGKCE